MKPPPRKIAVFGSFLAQPNSLEYRIAEELGSHLASSGCEILCGGNHGVVSGIARGAARADSGTRIIGIVPKKSRYEGHSTLSADLTEIWRPSALSERLEKFTGADGFIFLNGGIGSLLELSFVWHQLQVKQDFSRRLVFLSPNWRKTFLSFRDQLMIKSTYYRMVKFASDPEHAVVLALGGSSKPTYLNQTFSQIEAVMFDLDGTLIPSPQERFLHICQAMGHFFSWEDIFYAYRVARRKRNLKKGQDMTYEQAIHFTKMILRQLGVDSQNQKILSVPIEQEFRERPVPDLFKSSRRTLHTLKEQGLKLILVSSRHPSYIKQVIQTLDLEGVFLAAVGASEYHLEKPSLVPYKDALEEAGICAEQTLSVGDEYEADYIAPRNLGITPLLVDRYLRHLGNTSLPIIRSLDDLTTICGFEK